MKKLLLSLGVAAMACTAYAAEATTVVFDFVNEDYGLERKSGSDSDGFIESGTKITSEGVTITLYGTNEGANYWRLWSDGLREYAKGDPYFTVTAPEGETLSYVSWSLAKTGVSVMVKGTETALTQWTGSENSVTFQIDASANVAFESITVAYGGEYEAEPEPETPEFTVANALAYLEEGKSGTAIVTGVVSEVTNYNSAYGSLTYYIVDKLGDIEALQIYGGLSLNGEKFAGKTDLPVGSKVQVKGNLKNYTNADGVVIPEMDMNNVLLSLELPDDYEAPEPPAAPEGVLTVSEALEYIENGYTGEAIVKGEISEIVKFYENYGQIDYYITDGENDLYIYNGVGLNEEKFTSEDDLEVGATVEVKGNLTVYNDEPEMNRGNYLLSYTAPGEDNGDAGVEGIEIDNAVAVYYNLQGVRVNNPEKGGLYIIRQGSKTVKAIVR